MAMRRSFIVTFVGPDRPGIVEAVAETVARHGGNWEASRMARLAGEFAGILSVSAPQKTAESLVEELRALEAEGLQLLIKESTDELPASESTVKLEILGPDRPGIVQEVSRALASRGINVEELHSECISAPMTGQPLFRATAMLLLPAERSIAELEADLEPLAEELTLDLTVEDFELA